MFVFCFLFFVFLSEHWDTRNRITIEIVDALPICTGNIIEPVFRTLKNNYDGAFSEISELLRAVNCYFHKTFHLRYFESKIKRFAIVFKRIDYQLFSYFNPFVPNALFLYPLKTSENITVFWYFQRDKEKVHWEQMG